MPHDNLSTSPSHSSSLALCRPDEIRLDRRSATRHLALLRVALLHVEQRKELCVVRNISSNGLSVRVYQDLAVGEQVRVEFRSGEHLSGSVVWKRDWEAGIVFPEPIDVESVLASKWVTEIGRGRSLPRIKVDCRGSLKVGSRSFSVVLQDISQGGAKIQTQTSIIESGYVVLCLPELPPVPGVVRWAGGTEVGISFNESLPFDLLARWIQARQAAAALSAES